MLHSGQLENLKNVKMTRFPCMSDMLNVDPSIAGRENWGDASPDKTWGMVAAGVCIQ